MVVDLGTIATLLGVLVSIELAQLGVLGSRVNNFTPGVINIQCMPSNTTKSRREQTIIWAFLQVIAIPGLVIGTTAFQGRPPIDDSRYKIIT